MSLSSSLRQVTPNLFPPVKLHCPQVLGLESLSVLISGYKTTDITTQGKEQTNQQIINGLNSSTMISAEEIGLRSLTSQPYVPGVNDKDNRIATKGITGSLYWLEHVNKKQKPKNRGRWQHLGPEVRGPEAQGWVWQIVWWCWLGMKSQRKFPIRRGQRSPWHVLSAH